MRVDLIVHVDTAGPSVAAFMAPELMERQFTVKADIYSFGLSLLQMITRSTPYSEYSTAAELWEHKLQAPTPVLQLI